MKKPKRKKYEIVCSFDDGFWLDLWVADLLKKYNLSGTFYVVVDWIGQKNYLTWDNIKGLSRRGFTIGSHSMSHPHDLKKLYDEELHYEIQNSKDMLETALGCHVRSFCYPGGKLNERVKGFVARAGYAEARVTGEPGITEVKDRLRLPGTVHIFQRKEYGGKSILEFAKETIGRVVREGGYCNVWGHSWELVHRNDFGTLEEILKYIKRVTK